MLEQIKLQKIDQKLLLEEAGVAANLLDDHVISE